LQSLNIWEGHPDVIVPASGRGLPCRRRSSSRGAAVRLSASPGRQPDQMTLHSCSTTSTSASRRATRSSPRFMTDHFTQLVPPDAAGPGAAPINPELSEKTLTLSRPGHKL
jgi:hypothetical protein